MIIENVSALRRQVWEQIGTLKVIQKQLFAIEQIQASAITLTSAQNDDLIGVISAAQYVVDDTELRRIFAATVPEPEPT